MNKFICVPSSYVGCKLSEALSGTNKVKNNLEMGWKRNVNAALSIGIVNEMEYIAYVYPNTIKVELISQTLLELK